VDTRERPSARTYAAIAAVVGWSALALQYPLMLRVAGANGIPVGRATVNFVSYFTVLTNLAATLALTGRLLPPDARAYRVATDPRVAAGIATCIAIVGLVYSLVLRALWEPTGLQAVADIALHDVMPVAYVVFWFFFAGHGALTWGDAARWLAIPLVYVAYSIIRGVVTGWYPYFFLDLGALGTLSVARNVVGLGLLFWLVGVGVVALGRLRA
jgi:hypothetical protein